MHLTLLFFSLSLFLCLLVQFEDDMVKICMKMLELNHKHLENPAEDVCSRSDPVYVGRVISAMVGHDR